MSAGLFDKVLCHLPPFSFETALPLRELFVCHAINDALHMVQECFHALLQIHRPSLALHDDTQAGFVIARGSPHAGPNDIA